MARVVGLYMSCTFILLNWPHLVSPALIFNSDELFFFGMVEELSEYEQLYWWYVDSLFSLTS